MYPQSDCQASQVMVLRETWFGNPSWEGGLGKSAGSSRVHGENSGTGASHQRRKPCLVPEHLRWPGPNSLGIIRFGLNSPEMKWPFHSTLLNREKLGLALLLSLPSKKIGDRRAVQDISSCSVSRWQLFSSKSSTEYTIRNREEKEAATSL